MTRALLLTLLAVLLAQATTWKYGPPFGPSYFPLAVWLQNPVNAERYKSAGINLYVGLWKGPTEEQLARLQAANMPVICEQNEVGLRHRDNPIIVGWMHQDEPDNAQPVTDPATGQQTWGPCVPPEKVVAEYERMRKADPTRPILLNLGQGVINDKWIGRGPGAKLSDYETYVKGADIVSFDVYPVAGLDRPDHMELLWFVGAGVERLVRWTAGQKIVWNCLECTRIDSGERKATPAQLRAQAWMAIIHGSRGFIYFVHEFKPRFNEHALLDDPEMLKAVTDLNGEVTRLAPVINTPPISVGVVARPLAEQVRSSGAGAPDPGNSSALASTTVESAGIVEPKPVAATARRVQRNVYIFAVGMRNASARATFALPAVRTGNEVEVIGENRTLPITDGRFEDTFGPYEVHIYRTR